MRSTPAKGLTRTVASCRSFICAGHDTLQASLGVKRSQVQILSSRREIGRYPSLGMPPDSLPELQKLVTEVISC